MRITYELWNEINDEIEQYIPRLMTASESVGELFYEPLNEQGSQLFAQYITGLSHLIQSLLMTLKDAVDHAPQMIERVTPVMQSITTHVADIENSLEKQKNIEVADIIKYEVPEKLNLLLAAIKESR
jgi:hypothetical protein